MSAMRGETYIVGRGLDEPVRHQQDLLVPRHSGFDRLPEAG